MTESDRAGEANGNANYGSPKWTELRRGAASARTTRNARFAGLAVAVAAIVGLTLGVRVTAENEEPGDDKNGQWRAAVSVDPGGHLGINTAAGEGCPMESPDAHMLFFASNRGGGVGNNDIWVSFRPSVGSPWEPPVNLGAPVNSTAADFCPTPLPGNQLLFVSSRGNLCGGATTNADIYYTRLQPTGGGSRLSTSDATSTADSRSSRRPSWKPMGGQCCSSRAIDWAPTTSSSASVNVTASGGPPSPSKS